MAEPIESKVIMSLEAAEGLYHKLVLLVGRSGSGKTAVVQNLSQAHGVTLINVNLSLAKELLELTEKQRLLKLSNILHQVTKESGKIARLDNTEILFDRRLQQDRLRLLQGLSRNQIVLATWNGTFDKGKLTYGEPGHKEYRSYEPTDTLVVSMQGEVTVDIKYSSEDELL